MFMNKTATMRSYSAPESRAMEVSLEKYFLASDLDGMNWREDDWDEGNN